MNFHQNIDSDQMAVNHILLNFYILRQPLSFILLEGN